MYEQVSLTTCARPTHGGDIIQAGEVASEPQVALDYERKQVSVTQKDANGVGSVQTNVFDQVYDHDCKQEDMYNELGVPLVRATCSPVCSAVPKPPADAHSIPGAADC